MTATGTSTTSPSKKNEGPDLGPSFFFPVAATVSENPVAIYPEQQQPAALWRCSTPNTSGPTKSRTATFL
ncbi:MAG: hypothetical protein KC910_05840, partial [Candidatus Eremiobacteraeota bacterium]|nr:hypothetical protein [Candidatus Eremiobacteraeota bacterium]